MTTTESISREEFEKMLEDSYTYKLNVADVVKGVVVKKEKDGYLVDIGAKTEEDIKLRDEKEFYVMKDEEDDEVAVLSLKKLSCAQAWQKLSDIKAKTSAGGFVRMAEKSCGTLRRSVVPQLFVKTLFGS